MQLSFNLKNMHFEKLNEAHANSLLAFELENRDFFEDLISPRDTNFFSESGISEHINDLLDEDYQHKACSFVLTENKSIIARANIKNIKADGSAEIGYRVAKVASGKGVGSFCVQHLVSFCQSLKLEKINALVMNNNPASERVLLKNKFELFLCLPNEYIHKGLPMHGLKYVRTLKG